MSIDRSRTQNHCNNCIQYDFVTIMWDSSDSSHDFFVQERQKQVRIL